jgi:predicted DNA-binding ribbon-helix-helix protein
LSSESFSVVNVDEWTNRRLLNWILDELHNDKALRSFLARVYVIRFEKRERHKSAWLLVFRYKKLLSDNRKRKDDDLCLLSL